MVGKFVFYSPKEKYPQVFLKKGILQSRCKAGSPLMFSMGLFHQVRMTITEKSYKDHIVYHVRGAIFQPFCTVALVSVLICVTYFECMINHNVT